MMQISKETSMDEYTGFTKLLFGDKNVLGKKQFVNQMVSFKCNWALNPSKIRERIEPFMNEHALNQLE